MINFYYNNKKYHFEFGRYQSNDRLYISMVDSDTLEPYTNITVNFHVLNSYPYNFLCLDVNHFPNVVKLFYELDLITDSCFSIPSGFVLYPVYSIDLDRLSLFSFGSPFKQPFQADKIFNKVR